MPFLIAPFGARAVLPSWQPASPLAQPDNVTGEHFLAGTSPTSPVVSLAVVAAGALGIVARPVLHPRLQLWKVFPRRR